MVILFTDAFDDRNSLLKGLSHLKQQRHDVALVQVLDPAEMSFPFHDPVRLHGLEAWPEVEIDAGAIRQAYLAEFQTFRTGVEQACRAQGVRYVLAATDEPFDRIITRLLTGRDASSGRH